MHAPLGFFGSSMGAGEILVVLVVLLLLFGADRLPGIARTLGKTLGEFRRTANDLARDLMAGERGPAPGNEARPAEPDDETPPDDRAG